MLSLTTHDSSFVARTRLMPDMKKTRPRTPYVASILMLRAPFGVFTNKMAAYIKPIIPRVVSIAPKILFIFNL